MATATPPRPAPSPGKLGEQKQRIRGPLDSLRAFIRAYVTLEGLATVILFLAAWFWIGLLLDWGLFKVGSTDIVQVLPWAFRLVVLVGLTGALLALLVTTVLMRLLVQFSDVAVALVLERMFPRLLGDRLITAVELNDPDKAATYGYSADMVRHTINEAAALVDKVPVREAFDWGRLVRRGLLILLATLGVYALAAGSFALASTYNSQPATEGVADLNDVATIWFERNILLRNVIWPRRSHLEVLSHGETTSTPRKSSPEQLEVVAWKYVYSDEAERDGLRQMAWDDLKSLLDEKDVAALPAEWADRVWVKQVDGKWLVSIPGEEKGWRPLMWRDLTRERLRWMEVPLVPADWLEGEFDEQRVRPEQVSLSVDAVFDKFMKAEGLDTNTILEFNALWNRLCRLSEVKVDDVDALRVTFQVRDKDGWEALFPEEEGAEWQPLMWKHLTKERLGGLDATRLPNSWMYPSALGLFASITRTKDEKARARLVDFAVHFLPELAKQPNPRSAADGLGLLFSKIDQNNDKAVTLDEFLAFYRERSKRLSGERAEYAELARALFPEDEISVNEVKQKLAALAERNARLKKDNKKVPLSDEGLEADLNMLLDRLSSLDDIRQTLEKLDEVLAQRSMRRTARKLVIPAKVYRSTWDEHGKRTKPYPLSRGANNRFTGKWDEIEDTTYYRLSGEDYVTRTYKFQVVDRPMLNDIKSIEEQPAYLFYRPTPESQASAVFTRIDQDRNGKATTAEVEKFLKGALEKDEFSKEEQADLAKVLTLLLADMPALDLFREIDEIDGKRDERVTMDNLKELTKPAPKPGKKPAASRKPLPGAPKDLVVQLFGLLDQDKNGSISEEEFAAFCRQKGRLLQGQPEDFREAVNKWLTAELERTGRATPLKDKAISEAQFLAGFRRVGRLARGEGAGVKRLLYLLFPGISEEELASTLQPMEPLPLSTSGTTTEHTVPAGTTLTIRAVCSKDLKGSKGSAVSVVALGEGVNQAKAAALFARIDKDKKGSLTQDQMKAYFADALKKAPDAAAAGEHFGRLFRKIDDDNNGAVTQKELVAFYEDRTKRLDGEKSEVRDLAQTLFPEQGLGGTISQPESNTFEYKLENVRADLSFKIRFVDTDDVAAERQVSIKVRHNKPPVAVDFAPDDALRQKEKGRYWVTARARIPFKGKALDDEDGEKGHGGGLRSVAYICAVTPTKATNPAAHTNVVELAGFQSAVRFHMQPADKRNRSEFLPADKLFAALESDQSSPYRQLLNKYSVAPDRWNDGDAPTIWIEGSNKPDLTKWKRPQAERLVNDLGLWRLKWRDEKGAEQPLIPADELQSKQEFQIEVSLRVEDTYLRVEKPGAPPRPNVATAPQAYYFDVVSETKLMGEIRKDKKAKYDEMARAYKPLPEKVEAIKKARLDILEGPDKTRMATILGDCELILEALKGSQSDAKGVLDTYVKIVREMRLNQMNEDDLTKVLRIHRPLNEVAPLYTKALDSVADLKKALGASASADDRAKKATAARDALIKLERKVDEVVREMEGDFNFDEVVELAKMLKKNTDDSGVNLGKILEKAIEDGLGLNLKDKKEEKKDK